MTSMSPSMSHAMLTRGNGNNVLRGGFGMFFNRNMGNLEYDYLRIPPTSYQVLVGSGNVSELGGVGLTYDTLRLLDWRTRVSSITLNTLNPDSNTWPKTYSYSASYARRIFWNQVVEAAYVGTKGRDLVSRRQLNAVPLGSLLSGSINGVDAEPGQPRRARRLGRQHAAAVPVAVGHPGLELRRRLGLQLAAGHPQPADRPSPAVPRELHLWSDQRHDVGQRRVQASSTRSIRPSYGVLTTIGPTSSTSRGTPTCPTAGSVGNPIIAAC